MPPALRKHHIQRWTPSTCDYIMKSFQLFDAEANPFNPPRFEDRPTGQCEILQYFYTDMETLQNSEPVVIGHDQLCPAHEVPTNAGRDRLLWHTGNWKSKALLIPEQRLWYLYLNHKEWLAKGRSLASMPGQIKFLNNENLILGFDGKWIGGDLNNIEPITPATITSPTAAEIADLAQVYAWNREHNSRVSIAKQIINAELSKSAGDADTTVWSYAGKGDSRVLTITDSGGFAGGQQSRVEGAMDVQFGPGKVVIG